MLTRDKKAMMSFRDPALLQPVGKISPKKASGAESSLKTGNSFAEKSKD